MAPFPWSYTAHWEKLGIGIADKPQVENDNEHFLYKHDLSCVIFILNVDVIYYEKRRVALHIHFPLTVVRLCVLSAFA